MKKISIQNLKSKTTLSTPPCLDRFGVRTKNQKLNTSIFSPLHAWRGVGGEGGFTIVEIITTIAIIAVISILGFTYANNYKLTQYNTVRASDIDLLNNTMQTYYETHKQYPLPAGNKQYFDEYGVYAHSSTGAYGVSGFITSETFGKEFMLVTQKDPTTKYYYAYSRTLDNKPTFQFATSLDQQGTFYGYVKGTYSDNNLAGIVREYNGPNFVINNNAKYLPYNPNELKLTGNVISYSGGVQIYNNSKLMDINSELEQGYQIIAYTGALATINLSDGSELRLGSNIRSSILDFKDLKYKKDDNLLTQISLKLSLGEVWVKAPQLEQGSEFSLETDNAAASVRGTVFGMTTDGNNTTTISLIEGKLEIFALGNNGEHLPTFPGINIGSTGAIASTRGDGGASTIMSVPEGGTPVHLSYVENTTNVYSSTSSTGTVSDSTVDQIMQPQIKVKSSYIPKILSFEKNTNNGSLKIANIGANYYNLKYMTGGISSSISSYTGGNMDANSASHVISLNNLNGVNAISFQICDNNSSIMFAPLCTNVRPCIAENSENYCSSWKTIGFDDKPISVTEESFQKIEIQKLQAEGCPDGQEWSTISNQCELPGLLAYAGYDAPGDIFMHVNNGLVLSMTSSNVISSTTYINTGITSFSSINIPGGNLSKQPNLMNGIFSGGTSCTKGTDISYTSTISSIGGFNSFRCGYSSFLLNDKLPNKIENRGIFIGDKYYLGLSTGGKLSFDLKPLQLGDNFAIETSVRGASLKRNDANHVVIGGIMQINLQQIDKNLYFSLTNGKSECTGNRFLSGGNIANLINNNEFYKVVGYYNNGAGGVYIQNSQGAKLTSISCSNVYLPNYTQQLFIGSSSSSTNQWNDIIDYVKVYKY